MMRASRSSRRSTAPVTLAGLLAGMHAEILTDVVFPQITNPGTPVLYASAAHTTDLRTMGHLAMRRRSMTEDQINDLLIENPKRFLAFR
jgi:hypothetical protein